MARHPEPERLTTLARACGDLSRTAGTASEDLLDALVTVGDHATQRALDDAVDALAAGLRTVGADCAELAVVLGAAGAPADGTVTGDLPRPARVRP